MKITPARTVLVDATNFDELLPGILEVVSKAMFLGLDCETDDRDRHAGLTTFCKYDPETGHKKRGKLVFDMRRSNLDGLSIYAEGHDVAWYFNIYHADVENRIPWAKMVQVLDARSDAASWVCHNSPYELTIFKNCTGYELTNTICTMQMAVTAFGDDEYDRDRFVTRDLGDLQKWVNPLLDACMKSTLPEPGQKFSRAVEDIIGKITAKEADSAGSYNGYVADIAYGHGLKGLVKAFFGHQMSTFAETLGDDAHMGQLTGAQVAEYGAEDAFWVIPLFRTLMAYIAEKSPNALGTFFTQENPMAEVFSDIWIGGMRVNFEAIESRRVVERMTYAAQLRELRAALRTITVPAEPNAEMLKRETWYANNWQGYRARIMNWARMADTDDDYEECFRVGSAVSNAWAVDRKDTRAKSPLSITHYMVVRTIVHDLLGAKLLFSKGKIKCDGEGRAKIKETYDLDSVEAKVLDLMTSLTSVEQRMKLYLTPWILLTDPETRRLYPSITSMLNSRRMAMRDPNSNQMAKRGESTYVRGFILGDNDDHLIVSLDWSAIELVIIGELSGDPGFFKAFGQLPHEDMHAGAAADILRVEMPFLSEESFLDLRRFSNPNDWCDHWGFDPAHTARLFTNLKGEDIADPGKARSYWRTEIGKGSNFNYWFSGFLTTVGERMGWSMQKTGQATEFYRNRFPVAEDWRVSLLHQGQLKGWVELPDGHRRRRYEATVEWLDMFKDKWPNVEEIRPAVHEIARRIHRRAGNQLVNSMVQGTCATIMKRSSRRIRDAIPKMGWGEGRARLIMPNHDEGVFSVHHEIVPEFIEMARSIMVSHDDIFPTLKLDATPAVGRTFEPWHLEKAPFGQVELYEAPKASFITPSSEGKRLSPDEVREVCKYLMAA